MNHNTQVTNLQGLKALHSRLEVLLRTENLFGEGENLRRIVGLESALSILHALSKTFRS